MSYEVGKNLFPEIGCLNGVPVNLIKKFDTATSAWTIDKVFTADPLTGALVNVPAPWPNLVFGACVPDTDRDNFVKCDPATGATVILVVSYAAGVPTAVAYNLNGTLYAGSIAALVQCPDSDAESDPVPFCFAGVPVTQWVLKVNGVPTGVVFWTNAAGAVIAAPSGPTLLPGSCASTLFTMPACLTPSGGLSRPVLALYRVAPNDAVGVSYTELDGTPIVTVTSDVVSAGECKARCLTCR